MANTPYSTRGFTSGSVAVTVLAGETSKNKLVKNVEVFNGDTLTQNVFIFTEVSSASYIHGVATLTPKGTFVWEVGTTISGSSESLRVVLGTSASTVNCTYHCLYAEIA
jgi:hypothetical protein